MSSTPTSVPAPMLRPGCQPQRVVVWALVGSQFVMRAMAALQHKRIDYRLKFVHPTRLRSELPPPHTVPVMKWDDVQVEGSDNILRFLDERVEGQRFFPPGRDDVAAMDEHIANTFNAYALYFNWLDRECFDRTIGVMVARQIPWLLRCVPPPSRPAARPAVSALIVVAASLSLPGSSRGRRGTGWASV